MHERIITKQMSSHLLFLCRNSTTMTGNCLSHDSLCLSMISGSMVIIHLAPQKYCLAWGHDTQGSLPFTTEARRNEFRLDLKCVLNYNVQAQLEIFQCYTQMSWIVSRGRGGDIRISTLQLSFFRAGVAQRAPTPQLQDRCLLAEH